MPFFSTILYILFVDINKSSSQKKKKKKRPRAREVSGWNDQVKLERDRSLFWHWIWLESGKQNTGFVSQIMTALVISIIMRCAVVEIKIN